MFNLVLASGYYVSGYICYSLGDYLTAIDSYSQAIQLYSQDATVYFNREYLG